MYNCKFYTFISLTLIYCIQYYTLAVSWSNTSFHMDRVRYTCTSEGTHSHHYITASEIQLRTNMCVHVAVYTNTVHYKWGEGCCELDSVWLVTSTVLHQYPSTHTHRVVYTWLYENILVYAHTQQCGVSRTHACTQDWPIRTASCANSVSNFVKINACSKGGASICIHNVYTHPLVLSISDN